METIVDGTGEGYEAKVDKNKRLHTFAVSQSIFETAAINGNSYNINTGVISLTSANKSSVFYLKNNSDSSLYVSAIGFLLGNSTGGTGDLKLEVVRNPISGTIIDGATVVDVISNKNYGSTKSISVDAFKGGEGLTLTSGDLSYSTLLSKSATNYAIATGTIVIPKGSSIGVEITPQASNTAMDAEVFLSVIADA